MAEIINFADARKKRTTQEAPKNTTKTLTAEETTALLNTLQSTHSSLMSILGGEIPLTTPLTEQQKNEAQDLSQRLFGHIFKLNKLGQQCSNAQLSEIENDIKRARSLLGPLNTDPNTDH